MSIGKVIQPSQLPQIGTIKSGELPGLNKSTTKTSADSFTDMLTNGVNKVDTSIKDFEGVSKQFANGEKVNLHELILKGEHADLNLRLMMNIRSKVVEAYQEIMRMPV